MFILVIFLMHFTSFSQAYMRLQEKCKFLCNTLTRNGVTNATGKTDIDSCSNYLLMENKLIYILIYPSFVGRVGKDS